MLLDVTGLSVAIQRGKTSLPAVRDLSFGIEAGEILGILGESGCGKTLTALSIPGLLPPGVSQTGGTIHFAGAGLGALSPRELSRLRGRDISMVFQEPASSLNPLQRIGVQVAEPLLLHGERQGVRRRVLEALENLGLPDHQRVFRAYPHQLSGGMCQRVMIALAVINRPRLLIADEPTTALDCSTQAQILELLKRINQELGTAILFISHDLSVIRQFCTRLLVMYAGRIVESGPSEAVFRRPLHEYTRLLLNAIPSPDRRGKPLAKIPGRLPPLEAPPPGCPFAPRCPAALPHCDAAFPAAAAEGEHRAHCVLAASGRAAAHGETRGAPRWGAGTAPPQRRPRKPGG